MHAAKLKTANKKSLITKKNTALQNSTKRDPLVEKLSRMGNVPNPKEHAAVLKHAPPNQQASNQQLLLMLQQQYGNDYVNQVLELAQGDRQETSATAKVEPMEQPVVQAKMAIGQAGDKYEQEADRTAHQVIQKMSESETESADERVAVEEETESPQIQQKCGCGGKDETVQRKSDNTLQSEEILAEDVENQGSTKEPELEDTENEDLIIQRKPKETNAEATPDLTRSLKQQKGKGQPLPDGLKQQMEGAFGKDFSGVKIHADTEADRLTRSIKARAFTIGQDIFFRQGEYTPGSMQGQELLAHELTHVVQQGGSGDKSSEDTGVNVSEVSEDVGIQRACAQCEEEKAEGMIQAKKESGTADKKGTSLEGCGGSQSAKLSGQASGKQAEASGGFGAKDSENSQTESDTSECDKENNIENSSDDEQSQENQPCPSEREESESPPAEFSQNTNTNSSSTNIDSRMGVGAARERMQNPEADRTKKNTESEVTQDRTKLDKAAECESKGKGDRQKSAFSPLSSLESMASILIPPKANSKARKEKDNEATKAENKPTNQNTSLALTSAINPQNTANTSRPNKSQATVPQQNITSEPTGDRVATEIDAPKTSGQLKTTDAKIARLASAQIAFKLPQQQESDNNNAALEEQRVTSSSMASNFFTDAAARVQKVTGLGQHISGRINKASANAKAAVLSTVRQQKATVSAQINQQRAQVQSQTQATLAEIQNQHQTTLENISQQTKATSQQIQTEYNNAFERLDEQKSKLFTDIDAVYSDTYDRYIDAGNKVGDEAIKIGEEYRQKYLAEAEQERQENQEFEREIDEQVNDLKASNSTHSSESLGIQPDNPNKKLREIAENIEENKAEVSQNAGKDAKSRTKADMAKQVAKEYQKQVKNTATQQANQLAESKPEAVEGICCAITQIYEKLETNQAETLNCLGELEQDTITEATNVQTELNESVNETQQTSLESLDQQETTHLHTLQEHGDRQIATIERDSQKAIASIEKGVNQAATELLTALQSYYDEFQGMEAPHPDDLKTTLADVLQEFDSNASTVEAETERAIAASTQGIQQGEQQASGALNAIAQSAIEEVGIVAEETSNIFIALNRGSVDAFNQFKDAYTEQSDRFIENTTTGLTEATQNIIQSLNCIYSNIETGLQESIPQLEESLWSTLDCLRTDIENYAKKSVGEDEEWWQKLSKALIFVAVLIISLVAAPILAGLVGAIGAVILSVALGTLLGALAQIANNAIDGKDLMKDVGKAAAMGAIGGLFGGAGGVLGRALGQLGKGFGKSFIEYGIGIYSDIIGEIVGNVATGQEITAKGILLGVAIGTTVHVSTAKAHGINKRAEAAKTFDKKPDLVDRLPKMEPEEINVLAKETGINPAELQRLKNLKPEELKKYIDDAKERTSQQDGITLKLAQSFENMQKRGYQFGEKVGSKVTQPIKNTFSSKQEGDNANVRADADTSRGLKPDTDVPMTQRERDILANTTLKGGDKLTSEELRTEFEVAGKSKRKPINEREYYEEIELPNGHKLKRRKSDGGWCRFTTQICYDANKQPGQQQSDEGRRILPRERSKRDREEKQTARQNQPPRKSIRTTKSSINYQKNDPVLETYKESVDGTKLFLGNKRPGTNKKTENFWQNIKNQNSNINQTTKDFFSSNHRKNITLYKSKVKIGNNDDSYEYLPRKRDYEKLKEQDREKFDKKGGFATIGHKMQWQKYIAKNLDSKLYLVKHFESGKNIQIRAYQYEKVQELYYDPKNLQVEGDLYNSAGGDKPRNETYTNEDEPLGQVHEPRDI